MTDVSNPTGLRGLAFSEIENSLANIIQRCLAADARVLLAGVRLPEPGRDAAEGEPRRLCVVVGDAAAVTSDGKPVPGGGNVYNDTIFACRINNGKKEVHALNATVDAGVLNATELGVIGSAICAGILWSFFI